MSPPGHPLVIGIAASSLSKIKKAPREFLSVISLVSMFLLSLGIYFNICPSCEWPVTFPSTFKIIPLLGFIYATVQIALYYSFNKNIRVSEISTSLAFLSVVAHLGFLAYITVFSLRPCTMCYIYWCVYTVHIFLAFAKIKSLSPIVGIVLISVSISVALLDMTAKSKMLTFLMQSNLIPIPKTSNVDRIGLNVPKISGLENYSALIWPDCKSCLAHKVSSLELHKIKVDSIDFVVCYNSEPPFLPEHIKSRLVVLPIEQYDNFNVSRSGLPIFISVVAGKITYSQEIDQWLKVKHEKEK